MTTTERPEPGGSLKPGPTAPSADDPPLAFLFTDIVGSTRLWEHAAEAMASALARHDELLYAAIERNGGLVFATGGDGVAAVFNSAADAIGAAVDAQTAITAEPWGEGVPIEVRMGIHFGEVQRRDGDFFGAVVNRAARVMSAANGGQLVVSGEIATEAAESASVRFVDLGRHDLRGLSEPLQLFGVDAPTHPWDDRPLNLGSSSSLERLPLPVSEWFGARSELSERADLVAKERLVSILGPGGTGKTRTALELSKLVADEYPDGVYMVELLSITDPGDVESVVASTMGVRSQLGMTLGDAIVEWLSSRRVLVIFDNCEHVIDSAATVVEQIVRRCPQTSIICTTRERLGIAGERSIAAPSLDLAHASALFRERAQALDPSITFGPDDLEVVDRICRRVDSIPLAIELAAARLRLMSPADLEKGLADRFRLLKGTKRGGPEHHRTLLDTVDWSYQLMDDDERAAFQRLSTFAGWFDLTGADAVIGTSGADVLDVLPALVDKSMVVSDRDESGVRFRLLETLRDFAMDRLVESGDEAEVRGLHADYVRDTVVAADQLWVSPRQLEADAVFDLLWDDVRAVVSRACDEGDGERAVQLVGSSFNHALLRVRGEHGDWARRAATVGRNEGDADVFTAGLAGWWAMLSGRVDDAIAIAELGLAAAEAQGDADHVASVLCTGVVGFTLWSTRRPDDAKPYLDTIRDNLETIEDPWMQLMMHRAVTGLDAAETAELAASMAGLAESMGSPALIASARFYQGLGAMAVPDYAAAGRLYREGVDLARAANANLAECQNLQGLQSAAAAARSDNAVVLCRQALERIHELGFWLHLWPVLARASRHLLRNDRIEAAGLIAGFMDHNRLGWSDAGTLQLRAKTMTAVREHPDGEFILSDGAQMTRRAVIETALDGLDELIASTP